MSEAPTLESSATAAPLAMVGLTGPGVSPAIVTPAIDLRLTAPFPELEVDVGASQQGLATGLTSEDITAAAFSSAIGGDQAMALASPTGPSSLSLAMAGVTVQSPTTAGGEGGILATLQQNAHDQVMEIMSSYHTNSHRRRSSVEAAAAASSVLASIANSTKSYMDGDAAAAIAAAAAAAAGSSPRTMPQVGSYPGRPSQHSAAAAALLAASGMHSVVLPTIASVSASLQGTPAPGERMSLSAGTDDDATAAMPSFDANALSGLPADAYSSAGQIVTSMAPPPVDHPAQSMTTPTKTPTRRRKPAAARGRPSYDSMSDDDDDDDDDDVARDERGMPLTPDAPGSGRPGSLRHLTPDERRARRLQRNRLAAKECRQKKKAYINNLEAQVCDLQEENSQLRKEIEELNVKLTLSAMRANSSVTTPTTEPRIHAPPELPPADFSDSRNASPTAAPSKRPRLVERPSSTCDPMAWDA